MSSMSSDYKLPRHLTAHLVLIVLLVSNMATSRARPAVETIDVKQVSITSESASFEIVDDNVTTINYEIDYELTSREEQFKYGHVIDSYTRKKSIPMQTNSQTLVRLAQSMNTTGDEDDSYYDPADKEGEVYSSEMRQEIMGKTYAQMHMFRVNDLEPNKLYTLKLTITAKQAHLRRNLGESAPSTSDQTPLVVLTRTFHFRTTFDAILAAYGACNLTRDNATLTKNAPEAKYFASEYYSECYEKDSKCSRCKTTCYEYKSTSTAHVDSIDSSLHPVLCLPCPCDAIKSTGECSMQPADASQSSSSSQQSKQIVTCTRCLEPYTGTDCNLCKNEGIDYYQNEVHECVKCDCNSNSAYDAFKSGKLTDKTTGIERKCRAITGACVKCMYNTSGRHCHECAPGYVGDAIHRTCVLANTTRNKNSSHEADHDSNKIDNSKDLDFLQIKYHYKSAFLLAFYTFGALFLVLLIYLCLQISSGSNILLKNGPHGSCLANMRAAFNECSGRSRERCHQLRSRVCFNFVWLCPALATRLRAANLISSSSTVSNPFGGQHSANFTGLDNSLNDDDRLNLAEHQIFDESFLNEAPNDQSQSYSYRKVDNANAHVDTPVVIMNGDKNYNNNNNSNNPFDEIDNVTSSNPYRSITISKA